MTKALKNSTLFLLLWFVAGSTLFHFFSWSEPTLTRWADLLLYGRVTDPLGAARLVLWIILFMLVHLSSFLTSLFVGPVILCYMERQPTLRITRQ